MSGIVKLFKHVLVLVVLVKTCCHHSEEVDYFIKIITENLLKTQGYVPPSYYKGFELQDESKEPLDIGYYDFIIVGGGAAGSLLTHRLSEIETWRILLIEGGNRENDYVSVPGIHNYLYFSEYSWGFTTTPQKVVCQGEENGICLYPRGKGLGGTTLIHSLVHARGASFDYDKWAEEGLSGWSYQEVLPFLKKYENAKGLKGIDTDYHGFDGPVTVENYKNTTDTEKAFIEALTSFGFDLLDYNGKDIFGVGFAQKATKGGKRLSAAKAFLFPIDSRKNLEIRTDSLATKVLIDNGTAHSVEFIYKNVTYVAHAHKEVILSAGAVGSPQLLMLSGVGPSEELSEFNITAIQDLPVGKLFQDRPGVTLFATTNITEETDLKSLISQFLRGYGPLTTSQRTALAFYRNKESIIEVMYLEGVGLKIVNSSVRYGQSPSKTIGIRAALLHPKSVGTIKLASNNPLHFPLIDPNVLSEPEDVDSIVDSLNFMTEIFESQPMKKLNASVLEMPSCSEFAFKSRQFWECYLRTSMSDHALHPIGSCKMGIDIATSVVNERLEVHGVDGLRVVDASVMPTSITGHQFGTVFMIAEKAAEMIKEDYQECVAVVT